MTQAREKAEMAAHDEASQVYHDHPSNPSSCKAYEDHYNKKCPCEAKWRDFMPTRFKD